MEKERDERIDLAKWMDENMSHGAFALTQEEIDFYYKPKNNKED